MTITADQLQRLTRILADTKPEELDCDAILDLLAGFLEANQGHRPHLPNFATVKQHLRVCADCDEEFRVLLEACG